MFDIVKHRLQDVRIEATNKKGGFWQGPRFIILHYTANDSVDATVRRFRNHTASAHVIVGRDAEVVQMVPFDERAWHAGRSQATSKWGTAYDGLNSCAIGIEMINWGYDGKHVSKKVDTSNWPKMYHANGGPLRRWQPYTIGQCQVVEQLCRKLMAEYEIPPEHVLGHDEIAPDRKVDPGPMCPMQKVRDALANEPPERDPDWFVDRLTELADRYNAPDRRIEKIASDLEALANELRVADA